MSEKAESQIFYSPPRGEQGGRGRRAVCGARGDDRQDRADGAEQQRVRERARTGVSVASGGRNFIEIPQKSYSAFYSIQRGFRNGAGEFCLVNAETHGRFSNSSA